MKLEAFRAKYPERQVTTGRLKWGVIEAKGKKGAPTLVLVPGTLGMADIFWNQIVALKGKARVISLTVPPRSTSSSWPMVSRRSSTCSASTRRICWVRLSADS